MVGAHNLFKFGFIPDLISFSCVGAPIKTNIFRFRGDLRVYIFYGGLVKLL